MKRLQFEIIKQNTDIPELPCEPLNRIPKIDLPDSFSKAYQLTIATKCDKMRQNATKCDKKRRKIIFYKKKQ